MNIALRHNVSFGVVFQYLASDGETPINCTGGTLKSEVRSESGGELLASFDMEWLDEELGRFSQRMETAAVNAIPDGVHRWDLIYTDAAGHPHLLREGNATKSGTITEPS